VSEIVSPGNKINQGALVVYWSALLSMLPHVAVGGCTPKPKNDNPLWRKFLLRGCDDYTRIANHCQNVFGGAMPAYLEGMAT
jgi:hypothetical protein